MFYKCICFLYVFLYTHPEFPFSGNILAHEKHLNGSLSGLGEIFFLLNLTLSLDYVHGKSHFPALRSVKKVIISCIVKTTRNKLSP